MDFKIFLTLILISKLVGAQSDNSSKIKFNTIKIPHLYINVGAGLVNGGRADLIYKFHKLISAEISYGYDIRNFISHSDEESRFTLGLNYHSETSFPYIISLLTVYAKNPLENRTENPRYLFSLNGGYLNMRSTGFKMIARAGFYLEYYRDTFVQEIKFGGIYPNCEIGIGWAF